MKLALKKNESVLEPPMWIPYLFNDEIDIISVQNALFDTFDFHKEEFPKIFEYLFQFCFDLASQFNDEFGYPSEENQVQGAILIHKALINKALAELRG